MQIEFSQSGGVAYFPGLQKPVVIDATRLEPAERDELKRLIEAARFFDLPETVGTPGKGAADYQHNVLSIDDNGRRHTVKILVPSEDAAMRELVQTVQRHVKSARAAQRAASDPADGKPDK